MRMSRRIGVYSGGGTFDGSVTIEPGETKVLKMHIMVMTLVKVVHKLLVVTTEDILNQ